MSKSDPSAALLIDGVCKRYGSLQALDHVSLTVRQGEFFGLLGPNGAGKTTLISLLAGLGRADSGVIRVMGHDVVADYRDARRNLGVVPQELVFDPFFTVRETLRIQSGYFGLRRNDDWIDEILHHLDLHTKADVNMRALSGGMKRRVLVAQALVHRPPVIVLDEPTAGVDVELRQGLWAFVRDLNRQGHTIVLTTHYLEEAESLCGRIAMLKQGRVIALDNTADLLARPIQQSLRLRLRGDVALPADLRAVARATADGRVALSLDNADAVSACLARLHAAGVGLEEIELVRPDLEDVFISIMQEAA
jgi:ABC-2 type transport system ATP-binding protein